MPEELSKPDRKRLLAVLEKSAEQGFLGRGPVADHVEHAGRFLRAAPAVPTRAIDLGSGGGVPGLVLAMAWPTANLTLLEAAERRSEFLADAVKSLELTNVSVVRGRAEEVARLPEHRAAYDLVTARSFGPPGVTAECAAGFLAVGGTLLVSEPPEAEGRWPADGLAQLSMEILDPSEPYMAAIRQLELTSERWPRRVGIPVKRPLF